MLYYLASPYSHTDKKIEEKRLKEISIIGALLTRNSVFCIHPIASSHTLVENSDMGSSFEVWGELDLKYIEKSDAVIVADMDGWRDSLGVQAEIKHALGHLKDVYVLNSKLALEEGEISMQKMEVEYALYTAE